MELSEILTLVKAGYTKNEITQMESKPTVQPDAEPVPVDPATPEAQPVQEPVAGAVSEPVAEPVAVPVQKEQQANNQPSMSDVMQSIAKLTSAIQANAIAQSVIPQASLNPPKAEDMLAEIIRPTFKERS